MFQMAAFLNEDLQKSIHLCIRISDIFESILSYTSYNFNEIIGFIIFIATFPEVKILLN